MDLSDDRRDALHAFLQQQGPPEDDVIGEGALLSGWVVVSSWVDGTGESWLVRGNSAEIPRWTANGMLHEALYGEWPG